MNTETLLLGGPICPGLDLKADGGESASAGNTHAAMPGLLQSALISDSLMSMTAKYADIVVTNAGD